MRNGSTKLLLLLAGTVALASGGEAPRTGPVEELRAEPQHVRVQHVLIGFRGSVRGKTISRTPEEAVGLAEEVLRRAREGESFDALVREYSDDAFPGIYELANTGIDPRPGEFRRAGMVKAFGDVSFSLEVDEVGMAAYDPVESRYGWHVIKRLD